MDVSGSMYYPISEKSKHTRFDVGACMALLALNQCEQFELIATGSSDVIITKPINGFGLINQLNSCGAGGGGIYTKRVMQFAHDKFGDIFERVIVFSDSEDCEGGNKLPKTFAKHNYIVDVSSHTRGVNYKGVWTAEVSGWSEHFLTFIAACEGIDNTFED
jgi:60 kDa SS-A/Ro ribonucleoprotein